MKKGIIVLVLFFISSSQVQAQICVWRLQGLSQARTSNPEEVAQIIKEADKKLKSKLITVLDKEMTPPSGSKNDYMSMGRYWWPDPEKVDGLPYIRKDGVTNPEIDKLDRRPLSSFANSVQTLSLAYYFTSDEKYAVKAVENLRIWLVNKESKMNPSMNYGQMIPGHNGGLGRGEGILDSYSFLEMLDAVELLKKSKSFTEADQQAVKEWFVVYIDWLQTSPIGIEERENKNNHGTAFDVQLARYAVFVEDYKLAIQVISEFPEKRLFTQIEPDGSQPLELARTTALGYSTFNLTHFLDMCQIGKVMGIDLLKEKSKDGRSISKAIDFLLPYLDTEVADFPYQQIKDWDGVQQKLRWQLYRLDQMQSKSTYKKYYKNKLKTEKLNTDVIFY